MRIILALVISSFAALAHAESTPQCIADAEEFVKGIDAVYSLTYGPYQGDYDDYQLHTTVQSLKGDKITLNVVSGHTNEDGEMWDQNYSLTYSISGTSCYLETYTFTGTTSDGEEELASGECISETTAKQKLDAYLSKVLNEVPENDFSWLDPDKESSVMTKKLKNETVASLSENFEIDGFKTDVVFNDYCAAGAECWAGYVVYCDGTVSTWLDGEE